MFDRFDSRVIVNGSVVAETGLHIGSGATLLDPSATDSPVIRDAAGWPFIPGSSLKGALRAHLERLLRGLQIDALPACDPLADPCLPETRRDGNQGDGAPETLAEIKRRIKKGALSDAESDELLAREVWMRSCAICRLFGSNALAARLMIRDLFVDPDLWVGRTELRDGVGIDRDTEAARQNIKYDFEVVPATTRFKLEMILDNGSLDIAAPGDGEAKSVRPDSAFGLLAIGLRELEKGRVALGGKTTRGLGKIRFELEEIEVIGDDRTQLLNYLITGAGRKLSKNDAEAYLRAKLDDFQTKALNAGR